MKDPVLTARETGLTYTTDKSKGIRRRKCGKGFTYVDETTQKKVSSEADLQRIKALSFPRRGEMYGSVNHPGVISR